MSNFNRGTVAAVDKPSQKKFQILAADQNTWETLREIPSYTRVQYK